MSTPPNAPTPWFRMRAWLSTPSGIAALFIVGLAIRLVLAPTQGFPTDMSAFEAWAGRLAERGPWGFYPQAGEDYFVDYPPGYLYVLWITGLLARILGDGPIPDMWVKIPPILADLGLAWVVMTVAQRLAPAVVAKRVPVRTIAAAAILLNPAFIFISAVWGQADSVVALLVAGSLLLIGTGVPSWRREAAGMVLLSVALGTKPQAVFVIPVVLLVLCWRHIWLRSQEASEEHLRSRTAWAGALRVAGLGLAGVVAGFLLFAPFRMFPVRAFEFYGEASRTYRVTSVFAFNLWGAVGFWRPDSGDDAVRIFGVPAVLWGIALFIVIGSLVLARAWRALRNGVEQGRVLVFGSVALTLVGFAVVTRIHERYLFLPLALGAMLISHRFLRRGVYLLSLLYLVNVYFPYVYYVDREGLPAPKLWGLYDGLYGPDITGVRMRVLSLVITAVCLLIAWAGWRALEATPTAYASDPNADPDGSDEPVEKAPWRLDLHGVGRRGALLALVVFAVAFLSKVAGLGHPPGMYFDEVYHARTGAEYLTGKEVFEYTHPPFAKEVMGFAIQHLSGFGTEVGRPLPEGVSPSMVASHGDGVAWGRTTSGGTSVETGRIDGGCAPGTESALAEVDVRGDAIVTTPTATLVAGHSDDGSVLVRLVDGTEAWRANLPGRAASIAALGERAFLTTMTGDLVTVSPEGEPDTLAIGAGEVATNDTEAWVAFPDDGRIAAWDTERKRTSVIETGGAPSAIAAPHDVERVLVTVDDRIVSYDTETKAEHVVIDGAAQHLATVPETTPVWAVDGRRVRAIEPHSGSVIGRMTLERAPRAVAADGENHRLVAMSDEGPVECASGRPQFAWRLGSAIAGAAMVALAFLLALRITGSVAGGLLAALFLAVDGLAFTISRMAMNDSYATAFILGAWFCVLSALRSWRSARRGPTLAWLGAAGISAGFGLASKWPALYAIAGIGLLLLWDGFERRETSIWRVAGGFAPSVVVLAVLLGAVPIGIYVLTYVPFFQLGHDFGDLLDLQRRMFEYHSQLTATHPFGSPWYGWPFGYRAVFLYLSGQGDPRAEIWTIPNLVVIWGGLVAMVGAVVRIRRSRDAALGVILLAAAVQYLPWVGVTRVTFMYHYVPVLPWLAIALGWFLAEGLRDWKYRKVAIVAVPAAAVAVFAFLYPILVGWDMPVRYLDLVRELFPWVI